MSAIEPISRAELQLVEQSVSHEREERRHELRRATDRMDRLELEQQRTRRVLHGETGSNGLAGDVKALKGADRSWERVLWLLLTALVGVVAYFAR